MRKTDEEYLEQIRPFFENAIIKKSGLSEDVELILSGNPRAIVSFRMDNVHSDLDFECKMLEFLVRPAHKGMSGYWERYFRRGLFSYFRRVWTYDELSLIYTRLGNRINPYLTKKFIDSGFDMKVLED